MYRECRETQQFNIGVPRAFEQKIYHYRHTGSSWGINIKAGPCSEHIERFGKIVDDLRKVFRNPVGKLKFFTGT